MNEGAAHKTKLSTAKSRPFGTKPIDRLNLSSWPPSRDPVYAKQTQNLWFQKYKTNPIPRIFNRKSRFSEKTNPNQTQNRSAAEIPITHRD
jgi:hypothetical protein